MIKHFEALEHYHLGRIQVGVWEKITYSEEGFRILESDFAEAHIKVGLPGSDRSSGLYWDHRYRATKVTVNNSILHHLEPNPKAATSAEIRDASA
jgi:hypothetical protein